MQLTHALKDSFLKLKKAYDSKKYLELEASKKSIIDIQEKISKILLEIR